jgi:hypothetical protein
VERIAPLRWHYAQDSEKAREAPQQPVQSMRDVPPEQRVKINPDLRIVPDPGFVAWREQLRVEHGV